MGAGTRAKRSKTKNLYERDGVFYARLIVNGREFRRSLKTSIRKEAEARLASWLKEHSPYQMTTRHSFKEAVLLWAQAGEWKPKTARGYEKLTKVLLDHFGDFYWDQIDKSALLIFMSKMREGKITKQRPGWKPAGTATINRYLSVISGIADHVRELEGWPDINPVKLLPKKPRKEKRRRYVRPHANDVQAYFDRMQGTFGDLCRFALETGARMDEIASLKRQDAQDGRAQLWDTKSGFRVISLSKEAQAIVARQPPGKSGFLFETKNGGQYRRVTEMWREVVARAQKMAQREGRKLTRMRFHDLRHEYAIRYLEKGHSIYTLQKLLGHSTLTQTEEYLDYLTPEQAGKAKSGMAQ